LQCTTGCKASVSTDRPISTSSLSPMHIDVLIGSSAVQVCEVRRPADHPFATMRYLTMEPIAHRQSSMHSTTLWASGCMCWPRDASRGLPQRRRRPPESHRVAEQRILAVAEPSWSRWLRPWPKEADTRSEMSASLSLIVPSYTLSVLSVSHLRERTAHQDRSAARRHQ